MTNADTDSLKTAAEHFLANTPDLKFVDAFVSDLNGVLRGKRLPARSAMKLFDSGLRLPRSLVGVDIWGSDVFDNGLVVDTGDGDGLCMPAGGGLLSTPWAPDTAQIMMMMNEADGSAFLADPRRLLIQTVAAYKALGLRPVVAVELEFYLLSRDVDDLGRPLAPRSTFSGRRVRDGRVYAMSELDAYAEFFSDLYEACEQQGLPLDTAVVEAGPGQFEVNLQHQDDPVLAADYAVLLRRAVKGVAGKHNLLATFMAKPFRELSGNGMHVHMSLLNKNNENIFAGGGESGSETLLQAVAGLIATAPEAMIFFAPHLNSLRRFQSSSHAPTRVTWGYENRTAAIRIPNDSEKNKRFEHRVAGADANPYLVMAALLAGVIHGVENRLKPPPPHDGNAYEASAPELSTDWRDALSTYSGGDILAPRFGELFSRVFTACKRQEIRIAAERITDFEYDSYLQAF